MPRTGLAVVVGAGTAAIVLAAALLRPAAPRIRFACARFDPKLLYSRVPNCSGTGERGGRRVGMSYNSLGLRDRDYPAAAPKGTRRILLLGGSMIAGSGLEENEMPSRTLERALIRRGAKAEVIDGAAEGATTVQNAARLKALLAAYKPDAVVYHLSASFLVPDRAWRDDLLVENGEIAGLTPSSSLGRAQFRLASNVVRVTHELAGIGAEGRRLDDLLEPTLRELTQMKRASEAAKARFAVVFDGQDVDTARGDERRAANGYGWAVRLTLRALTARLRFGGAAIEERLSAAGLSVLALDDSRPLLESPELRFAGDYHWNAQGSGVFGVVLAKELAGAGLVRAKLKH
jgi:hypothetical protein